MVVFFFSENLSHFRAAHQSLYFFLKQKDNGRLSSEVLISVFTWQIEQVPN